MTKKELLQKELLNDLDSNFKSTGFKLNRNAKMFIKKDNQGWWKYHLVFLDRSEGWEIVPGMLIRINEVEDIFHKVSGFQDKSQNGTATIGISVGEFLSNKSQYRFYLNEEDEIVNVSRGIFNIFLEIALPFFEMYSTLASIDNVLNKNPEQTIFSGVYKGFKGLITAKILLRDDYDKLLDIYSNFYKEFCSGFYLRDFQNLIELLAG